MHRGFSLIMDGIQQLTSWVCAPKDDLVHHSQGQAAAARPLELSPHNNFILNYLNLSYT